MLNRTLAQFGLQSLGQWAWDQANRGMPMDQIVLDMRERPEYKQRFPYMRTLAEKGRAISEAEAIDLERTYTQMFKAAGLPQGFADRPEDIARLIENEVSPTEMQERIKIAQTAVFQAPPEVREELGRYYGIGPGELTAYWLDPDRSLPLIQQQFVAGQAGGTARRTGYGALTRNEAERLGQLGVSQEQLTEGLGTLYESRELFSPLVGQEQAEEAIGRTEQFGAVFEGQAAGQERIKRRGAQRKATFESSGEFAAGKEGISGLGTAG